MNSKLMLACAVAALVFTGTVNAQDCGCGGGFGGATVGAYGGGFGNFGGTAFGGAGSYGSYGMIGPSGPNNCGRGYTQQQAAALWGGYCNESCVSLFGGGKQCGLRGKCGRSGGCGVGGVASPFGYPSAGGCGCSQGCFGYPSGCCGGGGRAGGFLSRILGHFHGGGRGGCGGGCSLGGFGLFSKLLNKCKSRKTRYAAVISQPVTTVAVDQCGCGDSGQYFDYAVGAEYGTAGMQSTVAGEITGACSGCGGSVLDSGLGIPAYDNTGAHVIQ